MSRLVGNKKRKVQDIQQTVESLQSHYIHTQFHWSSGPPVCFPSWGNRVQSLGGYLCETGILLLALSPYIGNPSWLIIVASSEAGFIPNRHYRLSYRQCDNATWSYIALLSQFHTCCRSSFQLYNRHSRLLGGEPCREPAISRHSYTVPLVQWYTRLLPVMRDLGSIPRGGAYVKPGFSC